MKKILLSTIFLLLILDVTSQQDKGVEKKLLQNLLEERGAKFNSYSESLEKRSGIFGNKTKNDIKKSNEVLIDIVKTDNRIISTLYSVVDFRNYEKVSMNYDLQKNNEVVDNLRHASDTLSKQVEVLKSANRTLQSRSTGLKWLLYILSFLSIWVLVRQRWQRASAAKE